MESKLNLGIKEMYDRVKEVGVKVENTALSQTNKIPLFSKLKMKFFGFPKNLKTGFKYLTLVLPLIAIFVTLVLIRNNQTIGIQAGTHQAALSFEVASWSIPPQSSFGVWINSDSPVAFSDIELSFDPRFIKMISEVNLGSSLTRKIKITSMADANSTGKMSIVLGLDPSNLGNPPSGAFRVADLTFDSNTLTQNAATKISFTTPGMQLVALDQSVFTLTTTGVDLTINKPSPTPTPKMTQTPTPTPKLTPAPTPKMTQTPTPTPKLTPAPTPKMTQTPIPVLTPSPKPISTSTPNPTSLVITNVRATDVTQTGATISWNLSDYGTGQVQYGTTTTYGLLSTPETSFDWNYHIQPLSNLKPGTLYHYRVSSSNRAGQLTVSGDYTFTTIGISPTATPVRTLTPVPFPTATPVPVAKVLLSGTVTNSGNYRLISGISVTVRDNSGVVVARGRTDSHGHYGFYLNTGSYKVTVSGFGYISKTATVDLSGNFILNFAISRWRILNF